MSTLKKTPSAQWILSASFTFDTAGSVLDGVTGADAMANTSGTVTAFKAATGTTFDVLTLPYGSEVVGGELNVLTVSNDSGTSTIAVGDSASATRYLGATNFKAAARTALVPTGYQGLGEAIRLTIANQNGDATTGKATVRVDFIVSGRANENLKTT